MVSEYATPNMPLRHKDYFKMKAIEKKQIQEKHFTLHPLLGKAKPFLITWDNSRLISDWRQHRRNLYNRPY